MNNSQSSLLNLTNLAVGGDFNGVRTGTNTGTSTPSGTVQGTNLAELQNNETSNKEMNIAVSTHGHKEKSGGQTKVEGDFTNRGRDSGDFPVSKGVPALSLPQLNYPNGDSTNNALSGGKSINSSSRSSIQGSQGVTDTAQRQGYIHFPNRSSSSASLQRMHISSGIDIPLVPGSPQLTGGTNTPISQSNAVGYKSSQINDNSQTDGSRFNGTTGITPLNGTNSNVTTGSNGLAGEPQSASSSSANRANPSPFGQIRMGPGINSGPIIPGNPNPNSLLGMQMPVILNGGSDSSTNVNNASQRMMNIKSDLPDMSLATSVPNSMMNANGSAQQPGTPGSLLQNSTSLATSSLPTITILNDGEHVNIEGELIGKSGKPLRNTKRAAQNRSAQRAFRQRREKYIRDLEFKSRDYDRLLSELEAYKNENSILKSQLARYHQQSSL